MSSPAFVRYTLALFTALILVIAAAPFSKAQPNKPKARQQKSAAKTKNAKRDSRGAAVSSKGKKSVSRRRAATAKESPCHRRGYVDPAIEKIFNAALRQMKREGIKPQITSAWRSSEYQAQLHRCSLSRRCRRAHPGLYRALPSGNSIHEAGMAVDIAGVAAGPRGAKRLTTKGRRIVAIMQRNGFKWKYGLADPVHFEADPKKHGYRNLRQAIRRNQTRCDVNLATRTKPAGKSRVNSNARGSKKTPAMAKSKTNRRPPLRADSNRSSRRSVGG